MTLSRAYFVKDGKVVDLMWHWLLNFDCCSIFFDEFKLYSILKSIPIIIQSINYDSKALVILFLTNTLVLDGHAGPVLIDEGCMYI